MIPFIGPLVTGALSIAADYFKGRQEIKKAKVEAEVITIKAEADRAAKMLDSDITADVASIRAQRRSIKDEIGFLLLNTPVVMCFIPGLQEHALRGFDILGQTPIWFQALYIGVYSTVFGLRFIIRPIVDTVVKKRG